jgi:hypothetical protein
MVKSSPYVRDSSGNEGGCNIHSVLFYDSKQITKGLVVKSAVFLVLPLKLICSEASVSKFIFLKS